MNIKITGTMEHWNKARPYAVSEKYGLEQEIIFWNKTTYNNDSMKKSPLIGVLETLRKDILTYSNCLGLTPVGFKKINDDMKSENKKLSKLEEALINLN
jgi:hypothetical protein